MDTLVYPIGNKLYINLTNACTNACEFCIRNGREGMGSGSLWLEKEHSTEEYLALMPQRGEYAEVVFCGFGEPILRLDTLLALGTELRKRGIPVRLNTNGQGSLIYQRNIAPALSAAVDTVSISLNAPTAEEYDALCHSSFGTAAFEGLLSFAEECKRAGMRTVLSVVDTIGEAKIAACRKITDRLGVELRVRVFE